MERTIKVAEGHSIYLVEADYSYIRQCIGVPLANRNAKLNMAIRKTAVPDKAPTFDLTFVNGGISSKVAVFLSLAADSAFAKAIWTSRMALPRPTFTGIIFSRRSRRRHRLR